RPGRGGGARAGRARRVDLGRAQPRRPRCVRVVSRACAARRSPLAGRRRRGRRTQDRGRRRVQRCDRERRGGDRRDALGALPPARLRGASACRARARAATEPRAGGPDPPPPSLPHEAPVRPRRPTRAQLVLLVLVAAGAAIRFSTLDLQSFWVDEGITVHLLRMDFGSMFSSALDGEQTPPLYYVLAWLWTRPFGTGEVG